MLNDILQGKLEDQVSGEPHPDAPRLGGGRGRAPGNGHGGQSVKDRFSSEEGGPGSVELLPRVWGAQKEWSWSGVSSTEPSKDRDGGWGGSRLQLGAGWGQGWQPPGTEGELEGCGELWVQVKLVSPGRGGARATSGAWMPGRVHTSSHPSPLQCPPLRQEVLAPLTDTSCPN